MTSRERIIAAINHQQPDRVPFDLGGLACTTLHVSSLKLLIEALGLPPRPLQLTNPLMMTGAFDPDVTAAVKSDVAAIWPGNTVFGYRNKDWKKWTTPDGTEVLVGGGFMFTQKENGAYELYPQGDLTKAPTGYMPPNGLYFDPIVREGEIDDDNMNAREDYKDQFSLLTDEVLREYEDRANFLYNETELAIALNDDVGSFGCLPRIAGPHLSETPGVRAPETWFTTQMTDPEYVHDFFALQTEYALKNMALMHQAVGNKPQVYRVTTTDFGTQAGEMYSKGMFQDLYKPYYKQINDWIHQNTTWKSWYHCCGSIVNILDDFVEMGVDILNPVQCSAAGMDPQFLKDKYGDKLVFWGGGVDTQKILPYGTPDEVRAEVKSKLDIFSKGGGYIFTMVHNMQPNTPKENMIAMIEAIWDYNGTK